MKLVVIDISINFNNRGVFPGLQVAVFKKVVFNSCNQKNR
jgi:hypothetical protein